MIVATSHLQVEPCCYDLPERCLDLCSVYTYDDASGSATVSLAQSSPNGDGSARGAAIALPQG